MVHGRAGEARVQGRADMSGLTVIKHALRVTVMVDGVCVWEGTIGEWSHAIGHPVESEEPRKPATVE